MKRKCEASRQRENDREMLTPLNCTTEPPTYSLLYEI